MLKHLPIFNAEDLTKIAGDPMLVEVFKQQTESAIRKMDVTHEIAKLMLLAQLAVVERQPERVKFLTLKVSELMGDLKTDGSKP